MPNTTTLSKYLKADMAKDGDVITFLDAGVILEKEFDKKKKKVLEITVKFRGENKTYCPNGKTVKLLNAAWGPETEEWVGKSATITILPDDSGRDMVISKPVQDN